MLVIKKSTLRKTGLGAAVLLLLVLLVVIFSPGQVSFADGATCGDGVCDPASENSDLCGADCGCVDNGVADPGEGCGCKDVVCDNEFVESACGTPATVQDEDGNSQCPSGTASDGTTKTLSEFNGVCWDSCECDNNCGEEDITTVNSAPLACSGDFSSAGWAYYVYEKGTTKPTCPASCTGPGQVNGPCTGATCVTPCAAKGLTSGVDCSMVGCQQ